jgi:hypothetical protein
MVIDFVPDGRCGRYGLFAWIEAENGVFASF